jgi:hypothetical protein
MKKLVQATSDPKKIGKCTFVRISKVTFMSSNMNGVRSLTWPLIEEWLSLLNYFPSFFIFFFSVFKTKILANNNSKRTLLNKNTKTCMHALSDPVRTSVKRQV